MESPAIPSQHCIYRVDVEKGAAILEESSVNPFLSEPANERLPESLPVLKGPRFKSPSCRELGDLAPFTPQLVTRVSQAKAMAQT